MLIEKEHLIPKREQGNPIRTSAECST